MGKDKEQIAFRVTPQMKREIDLIMDSDGSRTRNEFLEHAVKFYIDHLLARDMTTLPVSVTSAIDGRLGMLEDRLSSQYVLGVLYREGGLLMPDAVKAKEWFTKSAEQGYVPAQYALGKLLLSDDPEVHDRDTGIRWLQTAARNGSPYAAYELGKAYLKTGDKQQAESYFTQAAEDENANAMYMLGKLLYDHDPKQANYWLRESASYGNPYAQRALDQHTSPTIVASVTRLLYHLSRVIRENTEQTSQGPIFTIARKRRCELMDKRLAMGHKPDGHEDMQMQGYQGM